MSSTTCQIYFANTFTYNITSYYSGITATCSGTDCILIASNGNQKEVTCDGSLQYRGAEAYVEDSGYICACGSRQITIPSTYNCADICYNLYVNLQCNFVNLRSGFLNGNPTDSADDDTCEQYRCAGDGSNICTQDGSTEYVCDNMERDYLLGGGSASLTYICNCDGAATVPDIYGGGSGKSCGGRGGGGAEETTSSLLPTQTETRVGDGQATGQSTSKISSSSSRIRLNHGFVLISMILCLIQSIAA